jgi:hypothetical protein
MVTIQEAVAMLSAGLVAVPTTIQEASAQDTTFNFEQNQENKCSDSRICTNTDVIIFWWTQSGSLINKT